MKKFLIKILFTKNEKIYIQQGLMDSMDNLHKRRVNGSYWESQDDQEDIDRIFKIKQLFRINSKKHYEGYY